MNTVTNYNYDHPAYVKADRDETIKVIREHLQTRAGRSWSVCGGRGTAWGWIKISIPPALLKAMDFGSAEHIVESNRLRKLLGLEPYNWAQQYVSIPASAEYRREYMDRARGIHPPRFNGTPYWD